jgi:hypothetical protein
MTVPSANSSASAWPNLVSLYPVYSALARESAIEMQPCPELEEAAASSLDVPSAVPSSEAVAQAEEWVAAMDERIHPHQLRQFLQTSGPVNEEVLQELLAHHLSKPQHTDLDRDKVDFLLVQLFSQRAPLDVSDSGLNFETVALVLEPVLGAIETGEPPWLEPLNELLFEANRAKSLNWLFTNRIIERGRDLKNSCGKKFFEPAALAAFTRFGFLIRRRFFRLMHQDLNAILDGLRELEARGVEVLDCRKAQFSADEPIARLRMICQSWKVMFHAEYSSGQPLCILVDLRTAVESALTQNPKSIEPEPELKTKAAAANADAQAGDAESGVAEPAAADAAATALDSVAAAGSDSEPQAAAAAAGADAGPAVASKDAPEFDVSDAPPPWDGDAAG